MYMYQYTEKRTVSPLRAAWWMGRSPFASGASTSMPASHGGVSPSPSSSLVFSPPSAAGFVFVIVCKV